MSSHLSLLLMSVVFALFTLGVFSQTSIPVDYAITTLFGGPIGDGVKATSVGIYEPIGLAMSVRGDVYYADAGNNQVRYFDSKGISHLFAGAEDFQSGVGTNGLTLANDTLRTPHGVALNSKGEVFICEYGNDRIRKVFYNSTIGVYNMITVAGSGLLLTSNISALSAKLNYPRCIVVAPNDELYICDSSNYMIRKVVNGTMFTVVGNGVLGKSADGTLASNAQISATYGIAFHPTTGEMYFSDYDNNAIRYVANNGSLYTFVASSGPTALMFALNGDLYVCERISNQIVKFSNNGTRTTIANSQGRNLFAGDGGNALSAYLNVPSGLVINGNSLYVSDQYNRRVRKIDLLSNIISTVAGDGSYRYIGSGSGYRSDMSLYHPDSTYYNSKTDELLIVDSGHNRVLRVNSLTNYNTSLIETILGTGTSSNDVDGKLGNQTSINTPMSVVQSETTGDIYVGSFFTVSKIFKNNQTVSTVAGTISTFSGDGYPAISAQLSSPTSIVLAPNGDIFFCDAANYVIRKIDSQGIISTVAGTGGSNGYLDGPALSAKFYGLNGLVYLSNGDLLISDTHNFRIRKYIASTNQVTTIAGGSSFAFGGDGGLAIHSLLWNPSGICVNASNGDIYISDTGNKRIRKITNSTGIISTIAGTGSSKYNGDGLFANSTNIEPYGISIHPITGELHFTDGANNLVRKIDSLGRVYTVIGVPGGTTYSNNGLANSTSLNTISMLTFSKNGDLYLSCSNFNVIKKMDYGTSIVYDVAGTATSSVYTGDGVATSTSLRTPFGLAVSETGDLLFTDSSNRKVRRLSAGMVVTIAGGIGDGGLATNAYMVMISSLALNNDYLYISDQSNYRIRKVSLSSRIIDSVVGSYYYLDNGDKLANQTNINQVNSITIRGNDLVFTDTSNFKIRKTDISGTGKVTTIAGAGTFISFILDNVKATSAYLKYPRSVAYLPNGELIIAETDSHIIRKVDLEGYITLIAGKFFQSGHNGDTDDAKNSLLNIPKGLSVLKDGRIIFSDTSNNRVRMLTPYCKQGYQMTQTSKGTVCNITSCFGIPFIDPKVCSGRGICQSLNNCSCSIGYSGSDCSKADYCSAVSNSYVCSSSYNTTETQITQFSNITQLDSNIIQFSSTLSISISLPSTISQHLQNTDTSLTNNSSVQIVASLSSSNDIESAIVSSVVSLIFLKSGSEKISVNNLEQPISFSFKNVVMTLVNVETLNITCGYYNENEKQWKSDGIETLIQNVMINNLVDGNVTMTMSIICKTNHLTSFGIIDQNYKKANTKTNTDDKIILQDYTVLIAAVVGGVGGCCVVATIITLVIVAICLVMRRKKK